jgi:hypothetical protein
MKFQKVLLIMLLLVAVCMEGCKKDEDPAIRPTVTSTDPVNKGVNIAVNSSIAVTFSVAMNPSTITTSSFTVVQGTNAISGAIAYAGTTATFNPAVNLATATLYTVTISGVEDVSGTRMAKDYVYSFTTGDTPDITSPTVTLNPTNNITGVALNQSVIATFSEPMDYTTITSSTFTVKQGATAVAGTITYTGTTATFIPVSHFDPNKVYTGTITTGVRDMAGNALVSSQAVSFTTGSAVDVTLPMVNATGPLNNASNVAQDKVIAITFSEAMDPLTINDLTFTLRQGTTVVPGIIEYSGTTATFTPTPVLAIGPTYTATITTGAKDLAGNPLSVNTVWSFTTSAAVSLARVDLGAAGNYVILAKTQITNIATSNVTGDLGLSPAATSYITGFALTNATGYATASQVTGKLYAADMAMPTSTNLITAVNNMSTAYTDAAGRPSPDFSEFSLGSIGGKTLTPGLYKWTNTVSMTSTVTLSGDGSDVWIFQVAGDLTMSTGVKIILKGGAQAKNIFWQVAGHVTLGATSHMEGIILSMTGITLQTGASMNGRALAQTAVILDKNVITKPQ